MAKTKQQKQKKKSTTSSSRKVGRPKGTGKGYKLKVLEKTFIPDYPGQDPKLEFHPPKRESSEKTLPEPKDEASKHKYPPPKKHPIFRQRWMENIENVVSRENFKVGHLRSLEILCDLYVEYEDLQDFIDENGRTYLSVGRSGETWKFYPEVDHLVRVRNQIKDYIKMLDLLLKKDHSGEDDNEKDNWT